jgi:cytochrome c peroxidase
LASSDLSATERADGDATGTETPKVPVALAWQPDGRLLVALRDARRIIAVDPEGERVVGGWDLPARPFSLALASDRATLLVGGTDGEALVVGRDAKVVRTLEPGKGPTRVLALPGHEAAIASTWDGSVRIVDWKEGRTLGVHRLPFAPGMMVLRPDGRLIVADAFGGRLADVVPAKVESIRVRSFEGVNLRALAISGDGKELLVAHMEQTEPAPVTTANVDRGVVLSSRLSAVRLSEFDAEPPAGETLERRQLILDGPVHGAADPSALALTPDGSRIVIALGGAHQLLLSDRTAGATPRDAPDLLSLGHNQRLEVVEVGRTPLAVAISPAGRFAVTADAMSDTLTVVGLAGLERLATIPLGSGRVVRTSVQRGEALFQDGRRSHDRWMSCASCHNLGHTNGLNYDTKGDGDYGAPKNTPSLLGSSATAPYSWTGVFPRLADQVRESLQTSLRGPSPTPAQVEDLTAYLDSLPATPPRRPRDDPAARRGADVFQTRGCVSCHKPPHFTIGGLRDVGLEDGVGHRRFNPPSLRGLSWSAPYLHDGRAASLSDLLNIHSPGKTGPLAPQQRDDLVAFLESL